MFARHVSSITERLDLARLLDQGTFPHAEIARRLGFSVSWVRKWARRYRRGGEHALSPPPAVSLGPLARSAPAVAAAVLAYRATHPRLGARRIRLELADDARRENLQLPSARTLHRALVSHHLIRRRQRHAAPPPPAPVPADDPHGVWQLDHQDHLTLSGVPTLVALQSIRAPATGLTIGGDLFEAPRGAQSVPDDLLFDALRRRFEQWGRPAALSVDSGARFRGQPQRTFPSRLELFCAGLGLALIPIRPGRPTDHGAVERLHQIFDDLLLGVPDLDLVEGQRCLDQHTTALNERFASRAKVCGGRPP